MPKPTKKLRPSPVTKESTLAKYQAFFQSNHLLAWAFFLFAFVVISFLAFYQLGFAPLENWDEAWYADVARNILQTKQVFVLYWNEALWLDKPPMYMWLSALVSSIIGISEFSVRVPSALSGIVLLMLLLWFVYRNYGLVPAWMAFITLVFNNLYVWRMRSGNIDLLATLLLFLIFLAQVSKSKYKYLFLALLFVALYMTRAALVFFPIAVFVLTELLYERKHLLKHLKDYLMMVGVAGLLMLVWLGMGTLQVGPQFFQFYLFRSDHGVASVGLSKFSTDYFMYMYYSLQRRFTAVLVVGVLFALRYIKDPKVLLMLIYGSGLLIQLSFTERSNNWYLLPSVPFWSLLCAFGTYHVLKLFKNNIIVALLIVAASGFLGYRTFVTTISPTLVSSANTAQMQSSKLLHDLTREGDVVARLDHLYPSTVYYSERKIVASPPNAPDTIGYWISRKDLITRLEKKQIKWLIGATGEVTAFQQEAAGIDFDVTKVNAEETILEVR